MWVRCRYNPIKTIKTSFMGTMNMLGLAKRTRARFLISSTSEVSKGSFGSLLVTVKMLAIVVTPRQLHRQGRLRVLGTTTENKPNVCSTLQCFTLHLDGRNHAGNSEVRTGCCSFISSTSGGSA